MIVFVECSRCLRRGTPRAHRVSPQFQAMQAGSYEEWRLPDGWQTYETLAHRFTICPDCKRLVDAAIETSAASPAQPPPEKIP